MNSTLMMTNLKSTKFIETITLTDKYNYGFGWILEQAYTIAQEEFFLYTYQITTIVDVKFIKLKNVDKEIVYYFDVYGI